jgi:ATP-binding cassette subfamily G (WHITE) protein 2 (SNQ2)
MFVDGRPLDTEFQRGTGFCEQMDLHDGTATIREALEFSAILRQDRNISRADKIAYVDKIIHLLELHDMQDALIRCLGVEQRKRVTIGVELAAKPSLLLFLDEPTSGLDSQSAYSIVRFLKKLSQAGQAIICTIHQPSSVLIQEFDMILALNPGGYTFYFGAVGDNGSAVIKYFADRGVQCPPNKNGKSLSPDLNNILIARIVAEFILETAAKGGRRSDGKRFNWNEEWLNSENAKEVKQEIQRIKTKRNKVETRAAGDQHEFASPVALQTTELTKRLFIQYWRDPAYLYGKLFVSVIVGIFNGFTFWKLGNQPISLSYIPSSLPHWSGGCFMHPSLSLKKYAANSFVGNTVADMQGNPNCFFFSFESSVPGASREPGCAFVSGAWLLSSSAPQLLSS